MRQKNRDGMMRFRLGRAVAWVVYRVSDVIEVLFQIAVVALAIFIALELQQW